LGFETPADRLTWSSTSGIASRTFVITERTWHRFTHSPVTRGADNPPQGWCSSTLNVIEQLMLPRVEDSPASSSQPRAAGDAEPPLGADRDRSPASIS